MGNTVTRILPLGSAILTHHAVFTMVVAGEELSILQPTDFTPQQLNALDAQGYKRLLGETRTRKLDKLRAVMKAKYSQVAAKEYAERNSPEEVVKRRKKREELDALREERLRVYEEQGPINIDKFINWPIPQHAKTNGFGRFDETCKEMEEEAERRARFKAERDGLAEAKAKAKADIEAMHRV